MASRSNPAAPDVSGLPFSDNSPSIEQLMDELGVQQAVLASLYDLPESVPQEIEAVKADIRKIQQQLKKARRSGSSSLVLITAVAHSNLGLVVAGSSRVADMEDESDIERFEGTDHA